MCNEYKDTINSSLKKYENEKEIYRNKIYEYLSNIIVHDDNEYSFLNTISENVINDINRVQLFIGYSAADLFFISNLFNIEEKNGKNLKIRIPEYDLIVELKLSKCSFPDDDLLNIVRMNKKTK
jgi:hypothetical protein